MKRLLEAKTQREVKERSHAVVREIAVQLDLQTVEDHSISDLQRVARSGVHDNVGGDRGVYLIVDCDGSRPRLGKGHILTRIKDHIRAYAINVSRIDGPRWSMGRTLIELIRDTIAKANRVYYVVLADGLTKEQATAGEAALFAAFGLRRYGGLFINEQPS
jgi:hypothetical protein